MSFVIKMSLSPKLGQVTKEGLHWAMNQYHLLGKWLSSYYLLLLSLSVVSDSVQPNRQQPTRLPRPWDSPGKNPGVGCHRRVLKMPVYLTQQFSLKTAASPITANP